MASAFRGFYVQYMFQETIYPIIVLTPINNNKTSIDRKSGCGPPITSSVGEIVMIEETFCTRSRYRHVLTSCYHYLRLLTYCEVCNKRGVKSNRIGIYDTIQVCICVMPK